MKFAILPLVFAAAVASQGDAPGFEAMPSTIHQPQPMTSGSDVASLLTRLMSFFDLSHIASTVTTTPAIITPVYDPSTSKFTHLSASVVTSGDSYYVPVCPVSDIVKAESVPVVAQSDACAFGIQLTPMPSNAAASVFRVLRTKIKLFMSLVKQSSGWHSGFPDKGMRQAPPHAPMM
ncbi:hypothetical protein LPJ62_006442 [Coemansia sp. RSA 2167]|nr:hypothetical protein LPJ62_006442 [Coemansia sp. RSA 2167]KAJ2131172.1 hypothetical protein GGF48_001678 [Coemansia sp. RSA 921]KAJ2151418.1 hypothetical protein J3F82_003358 [Coemansia sp. RSA 637]KAJ2182652.1 hypothetical protein GGF45_000702 [Coemansia sp. RSA 551]KAJ2280806.1 hypothetical protein EV176_000811 [Coemansia sp. RSA 451]KAJ2533164.1 hypothetical protein IWW43_002838 [Coemansia sp. RSA 1935]